MATPPPVTDTFARFVAETDYSTISEYCLEHRQNAYARYSWRCD